jgi:soluble lytic murein transglycosylase
MRLKLRPSVLSLAALAGVAIGFGITALGAAERVRQVLPSFADLQPISTLAPIRAMPRTTLVVAMEEARGHLAEERPWEAWTLLRAYVDTPEEAAPPTVLLAARAAAGWGGWDHVREMLNGQPWLDHVGGGESWFLLARAEEEAGRWTRAAEAHRRAASLASATARGMAEARLARVLREAGDVQNASMAFGMAAAHLPEIADWLTVLELESLAAMGAAPATRSTLPAGEQSGAVRLRRARAEATALLVAGEPARAIERLERESRTLAVQGAAAEAALLSIDRARMLDAQERTPEARDLLRSVAWEGSVPAETRRRAAVLLGEVAKQLTASEELARAAAYEAAGRHGLAARSLRAALEAGAPDNGAVRLRLGKLLFEAGDLTLARASLLAAADRLSEPELVAEAELYAARARYRSGDKKQGLEELRRLSERRSGTAAAGSALFLLGDASPKLEQAITLYRRAAAVQSSPDAREALFRVGDREMKSKDPAAAVRAWEEYVGRYPKGDETAEVAFRTALLHERAGREARARAMYTAAVLADPLSYYAVRAAEQLGVDPLEQTLAEPRPWIGLATDPVDAATALRRLQLLNEVGLQAEWKEELDASIRRFNDRPAALIALAEGIRDQGHTGEAVRLGRKLLEKRGGEWDVRLLRVVFPLPYRALLEREAERAKTDPMLLAALVRQESMFRADARSRVGASGLSQVMPATGRWLAPTVGIRNYEDRLLLVPEVNVRMGARYLADLMRRYDGARDLALAGYNAGPGRADRWRRELGHAHDVDGFRERIPFDETRHYVKIVLRNAAVYERLYGAQRPRALSSAE